MAKRMLIDATHSEETRAVVVSGNRLEEFDFETTTKKQLKGNIYLAKVTRVEPSLQAAFVDYGGNRHGFLAFSEIHPDYYRIPVADREALLAEVRQAEAEIDDDDEEELDESEIDGDTALEAADDPDADDDPDGDDGPDREDETEDRDADDVLAAADDRDAAHGEGPDDESRATGADAGTGGRETSDDGEDPRAATSEDPADAGDRSSADAPDGRRRGKYASMAQPPSPSVRELPGQGDEENREEASSETGAGAESSRTRDREAEEATDQVQPSDRGDGRPGGPGEPVTAEATSATGDDEDSGDDDTADGEPAAARARSRRRGGDDGDDNRDDDQGGRRSRSRRRRSRNGRNGDVEVVGGDEFDDFERTKAWHRRYRIQEVISRRQILLVQVGKEERGNKGAALTTYISLAGRYCVLMPNTPRGGGISRKIANPKDRRRLKEIVNGLNIPQGMAVIVRTAGAQRTKAEIRRDYEYLLKAWDEIRERTLQSTAPALIHEEGNLIKRSIRDLYTKDIDEVLVEGEEGYKTAKNFMKLLMPSHAKRVKAYKEEAMPLFHRYQVEGQIDHIHSPTVQLKSGGYVVLNTTEALVAIDVNSGRSTRERNIEETAYRTNLEAADEIARQLRLRDLAGLIVIDFIDMEESRNRVNVERRLKEAMKHDRARIQLGRISPFGLLEMSRQRLRPSIAEISSQPCPNCGGTGVVRSVESTALQILRGIEEEGMRQRTGSITVCMPPSVALYIMNHKRTALSEIEERFDLKVLITVDNDLVPPDHSIELGQTDGDGDGEDTDRRRTDSGGGDDAPRSRRRRGRRRRGKPDEDGDGAPETQEARDTADEPEAAAETDAEDGDDSDGGARRGQRRRGRRGGRRRSRRGADASGQESAEQDTTDKDQAPAAAENDRTGQVETDDEAATDDNRSSEAAEDADARPRRRRRRRSSQARRDRTETPEGADAPATEATSGTGPERTGAGADAGGEAEPPRKTVNSADPAPPAGLSAAEPSSETASDTQAAADASDTDTSHTDTGASDPDQSDPDQSDTADDAKPKKRRGGWWSVRRGGS